MKNKDLKNKATGNEHIPTQEELEAKRDQTFPGYPTYPASEDIMNNEEREELDVEGVTGSRRINNEIAREEGSIPQEFSEEDDDQGRNWMTRKNLSVKKMRKIIITA